jgi:hypothetical protein
MAISKMILLSILATLILLRYMLLGYVISKHGEPMKERKYNWKSNVITTAFLSWIFYELIKES